MIRRRRRVREIPFSFDSFLDIVANVVGIIIRLILVVWVGARSYSSLKPQLKAGVLAQPIASTAASADPLQADLDEHRLELARVQDQLVAQLRQLQSVRTWHAQMQDQRVALRGESEKLSQEYAALAHDADQHLQAVQQAALSSDELRRRCRQLAEAIRTLQEVPVSTQVLRYRTPVSQPVHSEELTFECKHGRVAFVDLAALLTEVKRGLEEKGKLLRDRWQVDDITPPAGTFRLHYVIEREHELLDALGGSAAPGVTGSYRFGLSEWQVEPMTSPRGETLQAALADGSEFRQIIDGLDHERSAVTFWVYPDSFELFRRLRDVLYQRDIIVAGRPLPDGIPIASSRRGSVSRGQ